MCGILGLCLIVGTTYEVVLQVKREKGIKPYWEQDIELQKLTKQQNGTVESENLANGSHLPKRNDAKGNDENIYIYNGSPEANTKTKFVSTISISESVASVESLETGGSRKSFNISQSTTQLTPQKGKETTERKESKPRPRNTSFHIFDTASTLYKNVVLL